MSDLDDLLGFWRNIEPRGEPFRTSQQTWTLHTMAPDQFCVCRVCMNENRYVQSVLQHFPMVIVGAERRVRSPIVIAAQNLPCGHWTTGFVYTRRAERITRVSPAYQEKYGT
jgi:hypothetical protein